MLNKERSVVLVMDNMLLEVHDGVVGPSVMRGVANTLAQPIWKFGWRTSSKHKRYDRYAFWNHDFMGNVKTNKMPTDDMLTTFEHDWPAMNMLWMNLYHSILKPKYNIGGFYRCYSNGYTHGNGGSIHVDDGEITVLYYANEEWELWQHGGTNFYDKEGIDLYKTVAFKPGRFAVFDAKIPHCGLEPSKTAYELRTMVVFKCYYDKD
jgi:hypothetical protein